MLAKQDHLEEKLGKIDVDIFFVSKSAASSIERDHSPQIISWYNPPVL